MPPQLGDRPHSGSFEGMRCCGAPSKVFPPQNLGDDSGQELEAVDFFEPREELVDRRGSVAPLVRHDVVHAPRFSPDGRKIAYHTQPAIWSYDLDRGTRAKLTVDLGQVPLWSPDGRQLVFHSEDAIYQMPADANSTAEVWLAPGEDASEPAWSHDGGSLVFVRSDSATDEDLWILSGDGEPTPFLVTPNEERAQRFSPDGRFIVYQSNESGAHEIYVRSFPGPGGKWKVSAEGGMEPVWSRDGKEIFYRRDQDVMLVDVETADPSALAHRAGSFPATTAWI